MTDSDITIRPAKQEDYDAVATLWQDMARQHRDYDPSVWCWSDDAPARWRIALGEMLTKPTHFCLVADDGGTLVGFVDGCVQENPPIFEVKLAGEIWDLLVAEAARGRGVGTRLMTAAEQRLRQLGAEDCKLHVACVNGQAVNFYKTLGFEPVMYRMYKRL